MRISACPGVVILLLSSLLTTHADMIVREYAEAEHSRFYTGSDKAFVGDPFNFSGVGRSSSNQWATLVTDNCFLSAAHWAPGTGETITFWEGNDPAGPNYSYSVTGGTRVGGSDLWLGWFDPSVTVDAAIARYAVLDLPEADDYCRLILYNYGVPHRVGRNVVDVAGYSIPIGGYTGSTLCFDYDNNDDPSVGGDETYLQGYDSGAPSFTTADTDLALLGIHWAIAYDELPIKDKYFSIDTFVPEYIDEINTILAGRDQQLTLIPESQSIWPWTLLVPLASLAARRRRRPCRA